MCEIALCDRAPCRACQRVAFFAATVLTLGLGRLPRPSARSPTFRLGSGRSPAQAASTPRAPLRCGREERHVGTSGARRVGPSPLKGGVGLAPARAWRSARRLHPRLASPCGVGGYASWPGLRPAAKAPNRRTPPRSARHAVAFPAPRELSCAFGLDKSDSRRLVKRRRSGGARKYASEGRGTHERKVRSVGGKRRHVRNQRY